MTKPQIAIHILGMHRSGTSALTGTLSLLGVDLGAKLVPSREDNPKGFFEHDAIWQIHHRLLQELGSDWHDIRPLPADWQNHKATQIARQEIHDIIASEFANSFLWAIKDPRMSRLFPLWNQLRVSQRVILTVRHPSEVAASLIKRDHLSPSHALALWIRYTLDAERYSRDSPRAVVDYAEFMRAWATTIKDVSDGLGLDLPWNDLDRQASVTRFLDAGLYHHTVHDPELFPQDLYNIAERLFYLLTREGSIHSGADDFDLISQKLESSHAYVIALNDEMEKALRSLHEKERGLQWLKSEQDDLRRWAKTEEGLRKSREEELHQSKTTLNSIIHSRSWRITKPLRKINPLPRSVKTSTAINPSETSQAIPADEQPLRSNYTQDGQIPTAKTNEEAASAPVPGYMADSNTDTLEGKNFLLVTPDIHGPIRNGGIGTAFTALAHQIRRCGGKVTVLYAIGQHSESQSMRFWMEHYATHGIQLIPLDENYPSQRIEGGIYRARSWRVHKWLQIHSREYHLAILPEWMGLGYYALLAKHQGLSHQELPFVINTHSPESWALEGNRSLPDFPEFIDRDFMERESVRLADHVVSPSRYLLDWMREHQWIIPENHRVIFNLMKFSSEVSSISTKVHSERPRKLVFFGRLEIRKGLKLFCDAVDRLDPALHAILVEVVFLGKIVDLNGFDSRKYIQDHSSSWGIPTSIIGNYNREQALEFLAQEDILVIIPSLVENSPYTVLECLERQIRFCASRVGGIPELIHPDDRASCLFDPNPAALSIMLTATLTEKHRQVPRPRVGQTEIAQLWTNFLTSTVNSPAKWVPHIEAAHKSPRISVCLVHHERPEFLSMALDSLRNQTQPPFEVVLVDDGSQSTNAIAYLNALQDEFSARDWQIIRQPNRYLGAARNRAAQAARGDYLMFMDDDNIAMPHELETFTHVAINTNADVLTTPSALFTGDSPLHEAERHLWLPLGGSPGPGLFRNTFGDANALWKKSVFDALGGFTEDYGVGHDDWELFAHAALTGYQIEIVVEPLFWYRVSAQSMLRRGDIWADHARSVRPYLKHNPQGMGVAAAYAICLHLIRQTGGMDSAQRLPRAHIMKIIYQASLNPVMWLRLRSAYRQYGLRGTVAKVRQYLREQ